MASTLDLRSVRGLYLHIPFCFHKCHYCDFYSIVDTRDRQGAFLGRMIEEIEQVAAMGLPRLRTVFIGGGTPTLLRPQLWERLLRALNTSFRFDDELEFTVEANPETVTESLLMLLYDGGVNRISIGAQSFDQRHLKTLERWHDPANVDRAVDLARRVGIENINLDLIGAIPGQTLEDWIADLDRALRLEPTHLSCYTLVYEPNTAMTARLKRGEFQPADEEVEATIYEAAVDHLAAAGFEQYEISNWARPGRRCRHNLLYWMNESWWALGPAAAGHVDGWRWKNVPRLGDYLGSRGLAPVCDVEHLPPGTRVGEILMLRMRLIDGIERSDLDAILADDDRDRTDVLKRYELSGLLEWDGSRLRLTRQGLLQADSIFAELI